jgi:hypothetical protein
LVAVPFVVLGFVLAWLIKEIPLRTTAFVGTARSDGEQSTGEGNDGEAVKGAPLPVPVPGPG